MNQVVDRRHFLISAIGAASASTFSTRHASSESTGGYIDVHTHLGQEWSFRKPLSADDLLRWMDQNGIERACVLPLLSPESWDYVITPEYVLNHTKPHRDRLIPFCHIDPRTTYLNGVKPKVDMLRKYIDAGAKGFGEHKAGLPIDDPRNLELYQACLETSLPVLFHLDNSRNTDKPGLPGLSKVLESFPKVNFIGHANGWWSSISGDCTEKDMGEYPKRKTTPGGAIDALMDKYPNIYGDLSAGSGANAIMRDMEFGKAFLIRRADRLMFGTDYLMPEQEVPQLTLFHGMGLPPAIQSNIFRANATRIFSL
jgi:predicted TIM-barrel fold metal-dependent hydrolase